MCFRQIYKLNVAVMIFLFIAPITGKGRYLIALFPIGQCKYIRRHFFFLVYILLKGSCVFACLNSIGGSCFLNFSFACIWLHKINSPPFSIMHLPGKWKKQTSPALVRIAVISLNQNSSDGKKTTIMIFTAKVNGYSLNLNSLIAPYCE